MDLAGHTPQSDLATIRRYFQEYEPINPADVEACLDRLQRLFENPPQPPPPRRGGFLRGHGWRILVR